MRASMVLIVLLVLISCTQRLESSESGSETKSNSATIGAVSALNDPYDDHKGKIIKSIEYRFQVKNVKESSSAIESALRKYPAYIAASSLTLHGQILENKITIRVESQYFYELVKEIDKEATFINYRNISTEDVTKTFVDLESRLKTKREVEARLISILRNKAGTIEELIEAEKQIGGLQEEIEATISRINHLNDRVRYSTINLEFYQSVQETISETQPGTGQKLLAALQAGLNGVVVIIIAMAYLWPVFVMAAAGYLIFRYKAGRNFRKALNN